MLVVGPNEVFIAYISQVLPSLGETNVEQRAAESLAPARGLHIAEPTDVATLKGSGRMATCSSGCCGTASAPRPSRSRSSPTA